MDLNHRKYGDREVDVCIVGAGASGGVLAQELAKAGMEVVVIEAGPFWNPQTDFASDELHAESLAWNDTRFVAGRDPIKLGHNNSGRGVGGGTVHFTGVFFRFHDSDFKVKTIDGVGEDWPITYEDLEPYYRRVEEEVKVWAPDTSLGAIFTALTPFPKGIPSVAMPKSFVEAVRPLEFGV